VIVIGQGSKKEKAYMKKHPTIIFLRRETE
jgi:hypothetical protein